MEYPLRNWLDPDLLFTKVERKLCAILMNVRKITVCALLGQLK
jgi:hypothetical protein